MVMLLLVVLVMVMLVVVVIVVVEWYSLMDVEDLVFDVEGGDGDGVGGSVVEVSDSLFVCGVGVECAAWGVWAHWDLSRDKLVVRSRA